MPPKGNNTNSSQKGKEPKQVARAACLSCRIAKRRCDGVQPHCGPCQTRGYPLPPSDMSQEEKTVRPNSTKYCVFVASKRGGPRYKGVIGAENELVKMEREAEKARKQQQQQQQGTITDGNKIGGRKMSNEKERGKGQGKGSRGVKRERDSLDHSMIPRWTEAADGSTSSSSVGNASAPIQGQGNHNFESSYQYQGNVQLHRSPRSPDASHSTSKKPKHLEAEGEQDPAIRDQVRARTAAMNAQQSFQQSRGQIPRSQGPGTAGGGSFSNLDTNSNFTFQSIRPGARSNSISSAGGSGGEPGRSPIAILEAAEIARKETLSIANQRPDLFEPGRVRHGTQTFGPNSHPSQNLSQYQYQHAQQLQQSQKLDHQNHPPTFEQDPHYLQHKSQVYPYPRSNSNQSQAGQLPPPPLLSLSSHDDQSQFDSRSYNASLPQINTSSQNNLQSGLHGNSQSESTVHSNHNFHPFAMPSPIQTPQVSSNPNRRPSFGLAPLRSDNTNDASGSQLYPHHNFPQSSSRDALNSTPSLSASSHIDASQNRIHAQQFSGDVGGDLSAHALSSANLDLWQRLQRESDNDGYGQDAFAQLYSFGDGSNPNMFAIESNQAQFNSNHHQQQPSFDQRELLSLDLNLPIEANADMTANILGNDFDITMDMFNSFYNKLENLPKAGVNQNAQAQEDGKRASRKERSRKAGDKNGSRSGYVDEENRARKVLSAFFENVYPTCPVLLPSSSLSSLAFYFTEKTMPCALWASISACTALHMGEDAYLTLRKGGGRNPDFFKKKNSTLGGAAACIGDEESDFSEDEEVDDSNGKDNQERPRISAEDIAAHHARTAEWLMQRYTTVIAEETGLGSSKKKGGQTRGEDTEMNSSSTMPSLSPSSASTSEHGTAETPKHPFTSEPMRSTSASHSAIASICSLLPDLGLVAIEATAAKTLLAHYYYGGASREGDSRKRAWTMAKEAWKGAADLELWDEGWEKEKEETRRKEEEERSNYFTSNLDPLLHSDSLTSSPSLAELIHSLKQERDKEAANISFNSNSNAAPSHVPSAGSPFSNSQRIEWARRTYWCAFEAATVMTTTAGYNPKALDSVSIPESVSSLQLRPGVGSLSRQELESATDMMKPPTDRGWATMIMGAQLVSRAYRSLYQLDELNQEMATGTGTTKAHSSSTSKSLSAKRSEIFEEMLALDEDIGGFLTDDSTKPSERGHTAPWTSNPSAPTAGSGAEFPPEQELHRALSVSGTLMATGATIILHRAQAYGRARLFMQPNCCVPRHSENNDTGFQYKASPYGIEGRRPSMLSRQSNEDSRSRRESDRSTSGGRIPDSSVGTDGTPSGRDNEEANGAAEEEEEVVPASAPTPSSLRPGEGMSMQSKVPGMLSIPLKSRQSLLPNGNDGNPHLPDTFFAGGPFLPSHSFNRCRIAAETMAHALRPILNELLKNIEVDDILEMEEISEEPVGFNHASRIDYSPKQLELSLRERNGEGSQDPSGFPRTSVRRRDTSSNRAQSALAWLNSADDSKRGAIIKKAPKLPPFSACSCVLGAYVLLMQSLAVRINSGAATPALDKGSPASSPSLQHQVRNSQVPLLHQSSLKAVANSAAARHPGQIGLAGDLITQFRNTANDFSRILDFFSTVWPIASDYKEELSSLIAANESLN